MVQYLRITNIYTTTKIYNLLRKHHTVYRIGYTLLSVRQTSHTVSYTHSCLSDKHHTVSYTHSCLSDKQKNMQYVCIPEDIYVHHKHSYITTVITVCGNNALMSDDITFYLLCTDANIRQTVLQRL